MTVEKEKKRKDTNTLLPFLVLLMLKPTDLDRVFSGVNWCREHRGVEYRGGEYRGRNIEVGKSRGGISR